MAALLIETGGQHTGAEANVQYVSSAVGEDAAEDVPQNGAVSREGIAAVFIGAGGAPVIGVGP